LLIIGAIGLYRYQRHDLEYLANETTTKLNLLKNDFIIQSNNLLNEGQNFEFKPQYDYSLYLFQSDTLNSWHGHTNSNVKEAYKNEANSGLISFSGGYFIFYKVNKDDKTTLALALIKENFSVQNRYLKNQFVSWLKLPQDVNLNFIFNKENAVKFEDKIIFSLGGTNGFYCSTAVANWATFLFILGFVLLLLYYLNQILLSQKTSHHLLFLLFLLAFKFITNLNLLEFIKLSTLGDVQIYSDASNSLNYYLSDVLVNSLCLLIFSVYFRFANVKFTKLFKFLILYTILVLNVIEINYLLKSLVSNSTLSFDFLTIFSIKGVVWVALMSITLLCISTIHLINYSSKLFFNKTESLQIPIIITYASIVLTIWLLNLNSDWHQAFWILSLLAIALLIQLLKNYNPIISNGLLLIITGFIISGYINLYINLNKQKELEFISFQISERQDLSLPLEFNAVESKINADEKLKNLINVLPESDLAIQQYLKQNFFSGYFSRYDVTLSMFDKDCTPLLSVSQGIFLNEGFFEDQINFQSDSTYAKNLFFVEKYKKNARYIAKVTLADKKLYVLLEPKQFEDLGSFPDLFLDQSQQRPEKQKQINYAIYRNKQNTGRIGEFNYPFVQPDSITLSKHHPEYKHYFFYPEDLTCVIISEKTKGWSYFFTYNSYLFIFISLVAFCLFVCFNLIFNAKFLQPSLTRRIQSIIILLLFLALGAVGITSAKLVISQFENDNKKQLQEKALTINNELQNIYKPAELFSEVQKELVNIKLKEYAHLFNTDITLYNAKGQLFNTSQQRLYELGLASNYINTNAYITLNQNQNSGICVNEKAGTLNYLSYYSAIYDANKQIVGYLNLPYFSKQNELESELSGIISTLINVYVILFVISIFAGLILAGYITRPLRIIQQQISKLAIGKKNEQIKWKGNDELGKLVNEYNQMLVKLEESALLLAQSEREDAWREMAKQVAHEIKNPLTPMKLNLQYLQHLLKGNPDDFKERFEKASSSIIEQIDTLANIATEFSNFAKLPAGQLKAINLTELIQSAILLFQHENTTINNEIGEKIILVNGDKDQALRVFNNLLKNALQALNETENPCISIRIVDETNKDVTVEFYNNGPQISQEVSMKLFMPNFTTKSTGSGLGLAMVNSCMQSFGGKVWFQNQPTGVSFYLLFTKA
jgi:two-component system nitrogen regulation sensor histidine kinase NtrY